MTRHFLCLLCMWFSLAGTCNAAFVTVGDFNPAGVDLTNFTGTNLTTFASNLQTAFAAGRGGVIDFEDTAGLTTPGIVEANFAADLANPLGAKTLRLDGTFVNAEANGTNDPPLSNKFANGVGLDPAGQAGNGFRSSGTSTLNSLNNVTIDLSLSGALDGNEVVSEFGFNMLRFAASSSIDTMDVVANFSDSTQLALNNIVYDFNFGDDMLAFNFVAPTGASITSIDITTNRDPLDVNQFWYIDDVSFQTSAASVAVAVPEPASLAVLSVVSLAITLRRRRRTGNCQ